MLFLLISLISIPQWTVGCYLAADNGLDYVVLSDMYEMSSVGSTDEVKVVIQVDRLGVAKRYFVEKDTLILLQELGDVNSGDPQTLKDFGEWLASNYPAKHYLLVLWDHGDGWDKKGICYEGFSYISVADGEFGDAIASIRSKLGKNIDIILLDACLMQMVEVASEIQSYADYMVGSEQLVPETGFPYDSMLFTLTSNPYIDGGSLSDSIASLYVQFYEQAYIHSQCSNVNLLEFSDLLEGIRSMTETLRANAQNPAVIKARDSVQTFSCSGSPPPTPQERYIDLCNFADLLSSYAQGPLALSAEEVSNLGYSVITSYYTGETLENSRGLSVWFPYTYTEFTIDYSKYRNLQYSKNTKWEKFVFLFYDVPDTIPPTIPEPLTPETYDNSYTVKWEESYDLTEIFGYELEELINARTFLEDGCEDFSNFEPHGFAISMYQPHSGEASFFSTGGFIVSKEKFPRGSLSFYRNQRNGELRILHSTNLIDWDEVTVFSGITGWKFESFDIDEEGYIKFEFSEYNAWVYIDDISVFSFGDEDVVYAGTGNSFVVIDRPSGDYYYRVRAIDIYENISDWSEVIKIELTECLEPYNYPNPFSKGTNIVYDIPEDGKLYVFSVSGKLVKTLEVNGDETEIYWDAKDEDGKDVSSGVYICRLKTEDETFVFKIACVR